MTGGASARSQPLHDNVGSRRSSPASPGTAPAHSGAGACTNFDGGNPPKRRYNVPDCEVRLLLMKESPRPQPNKRSEAGARGLTSPAQKPGASQTKRGRKPRKGRPGTGSCTASTCSTSVSSRPRR